LVGWFSSPSTWAVIGKYAAAFALGAIVGNWFGGFGDYKRGYRAGYQDGKAGEREKLFPNLFSAADPAHLPCRVALR